MAKMILEKLGLKPMDKLTKAICLQRVKTLRAGIKRNRFKGALRNYAVYYANWYAWRAKSGPRKG